MLASGMMVMAFLWSMGLSAAYFSSLQDVTHEFDHAILSRVILATIGFCAILFLLVIAPIGPPLVGYWRSSWKLKWANRIVAGLHAVISSVWAIGSIWILCQRTELHDSQSYMLPIPYDLTRAQQGIWLSGVAEFTLAFSCYDIVYMVLFEPDLAFMLHHLAILSCFVPLFFIEEGTVITTVGIAVAEVANPLLGCWTWSKENLKLNKELSKEDTQWHKARFDWLSFPVTLSYTVTRGIAMPLSLIDTAIFLFVKGRSTPMLAWMWVHCVFGFLGSALWIHMLISGYLKFRARLNDGATKLDKKNKAA